MDMYSFYYLSTKEGILFIFKHDVMNTKINLFVSLFLLTHGLLLDQIQKTELVVDRTISTK